MPSCRRPGCSQHALEAKINDAAGSKQRAAAANCSEYGGFLSISELIYVDRRKTRHISSRRYVR